MSKTDNTVPTSFERDLTQGNVKAAMGRVNASSGDLWRVPVEDINVLPGLNVRTKNDEYEAHVNAIANSIFQEGFYQDKPLAVFIAEDGKIMLRDGHTRLEATKRAIAMGAQIKVLPCVTAVKGTTMEDITIGLVKSNTGKPLLPIEVAVVIKRLIGWGWEPKAVAERLDYTVAYVNDLLNLLEAPQALQALVSAGKVAAGTAIKQTKKLGAAEATKVLVEASKQSKDGKVSAKHLKDAPPAAKAGKAAKAPAAKAADAQSGSGEKVEPTVASLMKVIKAVFNDAGFNKLSDKTQSLVLDLV